ELISEFGSGNGVSLIIFAGIVASLPQVISQLVFTFDVSQLPLYLGFVIASLAVIAGIVVMTEAERPVPVTYAKQVRGNKVYGGVSTYLPLRVNQAGVIPIIFALSILIFPQAMVNILSQVDNQLIASISTAINNFLSNTAMFAGLYFVLVFAFTYFYTAVTFDPDAISKNLQQSGAFIPGVRPGQSTADYLTKILGRITMVGATFLGAIAVLPFAMIAVTGNQSLALGGTALLIVVSVILDLIKKVDAQITMREF
ncbi:MAG TPA: preprotein translocase subunit SecY, partial [Candidatus Yonathbacteria bacterium]|nr:preprotein translocase subunit SecY [Candidatus Yonathbacteria bacterium]